MGIAYIIPVTERESMVKSFFALQGKTIASLRVLLPLTVCFPGLFVYICYNISDSTAIIRTMAWSVFAIYTFMILIMEEQYCIRVQLGEQGMRLRRFFKRDTYIPWKQVLCSGCLRNGRYQDGNVLIYCSNKALGKDIFSAKRNKLAALTTRNDIVYFSATNKTLEAFCHYAPKPLYERFYRQVLFIQKNESQTIKQSPEIFLYSKQDDRGEEYSKNLRKRSRSLIFPCILVLIESVAAIVIKYEYWVATILMAIACLVQLFRSCSKEQEKIICATLWTAAAGIAGLILLSL